MSPAAAAAVSVTGTRFVRTLLSRPGTAPDTTSDVTWLQGERLYCDLRRPHRMPRISAASLREVTFDDLLVLAAQDGFAGPLIDRGTHAEWVRAVGFHCPGTTPDAGTLGVLDSRTLVESGVFEEYTEHWEIAATSAVVEEYLLEDADTGAPAVLVRVGDDFAFARGRIHPLGAPLEELIRGAATLRDAQDLLDCEISLGRICDTRWAITTSTLPYRVGAALDPVVADTVSTPDVDVQGRPTVRRWRRIPDPRRSV